MSNLYRGPSIDASYQVSVHLAEGFQRRRLKCEKVTVISYHCGLSCPWSYDTLIYTILYNHFSKVVSTNLLQILHLILPNTDSVESWKILSEVAYDNWSLLMDQNEMSNLYRGPSIDASYQVSVHLAEGFQRRRLKCEKLTDDRRRTSNDGKSSHCLW
jgi:hypothetical protein